MTAKPSFGNFRKYFAGISEVIEFGKCFDDRSQEIERSAPQI